MILCTTEKCPDGISSPALSPTISHEGVPSLCTVCLFTWIYCPWSTNTPALVVEWGWCPEQVLAGIPCHKSEWHRAHSGSEASGNCVQPSTPGTRAGAGNPNDAAVPPNGLIQHLTQSVVILVPMLKGFIMQNFKNTHYRHESITKTQALIPQLQQF